jgi:proton glutamate symport protein
MQSHWKVLAWMLAGLIVGLLFQAFLDAPAYSGAQWKSASGGVELVSRTGPSAKSKLVVGEIYDRVIVDRGKADQEKTVDLASPEDVAAVREAAENGQIIWFVTTDDAEADQPAPLALGMDPDCQRADWIWPFAFAADIFMALLKMLIVPLVLASIVSGVASVGALKDLKRLGWKTFAYYIGTSLLAVVLGQILVNVITPGTGAELGLSPAVEAGSREENPLEILRRMVPTNIVSAMTSNGAMLQIIFFALLLGYFITRSVEPHASRMREFFESFFQVMMKMAEGVLSLLPYGVFALLVKVVAGTGVEPFKALLLYMFTVALALVLHACVTLPMVLKFIGGVSPTRWFKAMTPAIMTAFSTSSSSMTLPVTMKTVEHRGGVSNKVTSFTLPLGATINMDGTALYECIGVIFLAQYYASVGGEPLTFSAQALVVVMALLASIGAAGIPSAGLVMMLTILSALKLPVEGAALLLAVDRPLDMMRTVVNVWSDSCGAAVIGKSEGELAMPDLA